MGVHAYATWYAKHTIRRRVVALQELLGELGLEHISAYDALDEVLERCFAPLTGEDAERLSCHNTRDDDPWIHHPDIFGDDYYG